MADDELREFDVAIVVFMRAPGVDELDAAHRARYAILDTLRPVLTSDGALVDQRFDPDVTMPVVEVRELGSAMLDGYVRVGPTRRAYRDRGLPPV